MLSDAASSVTSRSINHGALSCAAACLCEEVYLRWGSGNPLSSAAPAGAGLFFFGAVVIIVACSASSDVNQKPSAHDSCVSGCVCERCVAVARVARSD